MTSATSEVLLFQVGPRVFASEVYDAVRIAKVRDSAAGDLVLSSALGEPFTRDRGIVVAGEGADSQRILVIDQVVGVRSVPEQDVLPLPAFAAACLSSGAVTGFVIMDDAPLLLVDLRTLVRERSPERAPSSSP